MRTSLLLFASACILSLGIVIDPTLANSAPEQGFGFDVSGMERSTNPGDDFYRYANGRWEDRTTIPADRSAFSPGSVLAETAREQVRAILVEAQNDPTSKIGRAYSSFMDEAAVEQKGLAPIAPWLDEIRGLRRPDLPALSAKAQRLGVRTLFGVGVDQDAKRPDRYIMRLGQSGLGLPDRDYYLAGNNKMRDIRSVYRAHLEKLLTLAGESDAGVRASALLDFETEIAKVHWARIDRRDADKTYNKMSVVALSASAPGFDFARYLGSLGGGGEAELIVSTPSAVTGIAGLAATADLQVLKDQLLVRSLESFADVLPRAFVDEDFAFFNRTLAGTPEIAPRWKRGVAFVEGALGEEVGKIYVAKHFPPATKAKMDVLVANVLAAMNQRIDRLEWMSPETKAKAQRKLATFKPKVGYPDRWRDYSGLAIKDDDLFGNAVASRWFDHDYEFGKLGKPIYDWEWGMYPQTVNAYASFARNEIVFPAAILQAPYFDPEADDAVNYGAIGAVIGHEISHHFDDQGSKFDNQGRLAPWWTDADRSAFQARTAALVAQYNAYEPLPGEHVNGQLTLGENIADLAGLAVAHDAWIASLGGKAPPVINGFTGEQRFYLGWAQVWRSKVREATQRQRLLTDSHSPAPQRADIVRNFDSWYLAFAVKPGSALFLDPEDRVRIW